MTDDEREAEAQRLMAILQGQDDAGMIDEHGTLGTMPNAQSYPPSCFLCSAWLDDDAAEVDGYLICEACAPEFEELLTRQVVCLICHGKRLIFWGPARPGAERHGWQSCEMCQGRGWIDGVVARWNGLL
jgi:hypothetical protein